MAYIPKLFLIPAYGRPCNSKKAVWNDWIACRDFEIVAFGPFMGRKLTRIGAEESRLHAVVVRYGKDYAKSATIDLIKNKIL